MMSDRSQLMRCDASSFLSDSRYRFLCEERRADVLLLHFRNASAQASLAFLFFIPTQAQKSKCSIAKAKCGAQQPHRAPVSLLFRSAAFFLTVSIGTRRSICTLVIPLGFQRFRSIIGWCHMRTRALNSLTTVRVWCQQYFVGGSVSARMASRSCRLRFRS